MKVLKGMISLRKFEGVLFCTDLDGTLYSGDKTISKENAGFDYCVDCMYTCEDAILKQE